MTSAGEARPPALTEVEALRLVNDPTAGPEALAAAVAAFPELLPQAAAHHGASPDLLAWAQSLGRPEVDAALAARAAGAPMFAAAAPPRGRRARRRPRLKSRWTALAGGVAAAALVAAGAWYFTSGNRQAAPYGDLAPDIEGPATLGPALDSRDVLEGVFRHSFFAEPLDGDTGLAVGYDVFPEWAFSSTIVIGRGMEGEIVVDPETGGVETVFEAPEGLSGSRAAVAGFDLDTGERKWQVDLRAAAGESSEAEVWYAAAWPDGLGNAVAEVHVGPTEDRVLLAIDGQTGEVFSQGEFLASPTACFMGIQLTEDNGGPVPRVAAYRVDNLGSPLWTAESGGRAPLAHTASGTFWVSTADGYVEAATGRRVGFDEPGGHTFYRLRAGGKDLVLLGREMNGRVIRVDPATGAELWATEMPEYQMDEWTVAAPAVVQQFQENGVPGLVAVDIQTGAELWSGDGLMQPIPLNGDPLPAESAILVRQSDGSLAGVDVRDGSVLAQLGDLGDCAVADQGPTVVYLACGRSGPVRYRALSLVRDGDPLWEVRPEGAAALAEASLRSAYGRMWVDVAVNGEDPSVEDHMVRYEIVG